MGNERRKGEVKVREEGDEGERHTRPTPVMAPIPASFRAAEEWSSDFVVGRLWGGILGGSDAAVAPAQLAIDDGEFVE